MEDPKQEITHVELNNIPPKNGLCAEEIELQTALRSYVPNTDAENKLRRNIDLHLMPILWIMYILNYIDRTNIGNAKTAGMAKDFDLDSERKWFAIFYSAAVLSGAFGGLLAGVITGGLYNAHGIEGWRWLFIIEGVATVGVAIAAKFILLDFPHSSSILSLEERQLAAVRILADGITSSGHERLSHWEAFKAAACDPRTYAFMLLFDLDVGAGTISYFIPTITKPLGYTTVVAQYMTVPVYVVATICLNICAYSADRCGERRWHISGALLVRFTCALVCATVEIPVVRYAMLCFVAAGIWSALPLILAWASKTLDFSGEKSAICIAMINAVGNLSSVYGSQSWPSTSAPKYTLRWGITAGFLGAGTLVAMLIPVFLKIVPSKGTKAERRLRERSEGEEDSTDIKI